MTDDDEELRRVEEQLRAAGLPIAVPDPAGIAEDLEAWSRANARAREEEALGETLADMATVSRPGRTRAGRRICVYVDATMHRPGLGFVPAVVAEGEPCYYPLTGNGPLARPYGWGDDLATAQRIAAQANRELGLTDDDVQAIVRSSLLAPPDDQPGGHGRLV